MKTLRSLVPFALALCACEREPAPQGAPASAPASAPTTTPAAPPAASALVVEILAPAQVEEGASFSVEARVSGAGERKLRYEWSSLTVQPRVAIPNSFAPSLTLSAPEGIADYHLALRLRVVAGDEAVVRDIDVLVRADDDPPFAEVFVRPAIECGETLLLVGQGHNEILQGITYEWVQVGDGPRVEIVGADHAQATCVPPENAGPYALAFEFHVRDGAHPDVRARAEVAVACEPAFAPLAPGEKLDLAGEAGFVQPLPRGHWEIEGSLELTPQTAGAAATATLRFEYGAGAGVAIALVSDGARAGLRRFGLLRTTDGAWREPESSGTADLGEWPADQPLGFAFGWDGHELAIHWGPPGEREHWPELPFPVDFPLAARPAAFALDVVGGTARTAVLVLTARD